MGCSVIVPVLRVNESQLDEGQCVREVVRSAVLRSLLAEKRPASKNSRNTPVINVHLRERATKARFQAKSEWRCTKFQMFKCRCTPSWSLPSTDIVGTSPKRSWKDSDGGRGSGAP